MLDLRSSIFESSPLRPLSLSPFRPLEFFSLGMTQFQKILRI